MSTTSPAERPAGFDLRARWLLMQVAVDPAPKLVIMNPNKSGATTFFSYLERIQPHLPKGVRYVHWDLTGSEPAQSRESFWAQLAWRLGAPASAVSQDLRDWLPLALRGLAIPQSPAPRVVLVLDHWDDAREYAQEYVSVSALKALLEFIREQRPSSPDQPLLGQVVVTRFPQTELLVDYAHRNRSLGFQQLSGDIERYSMVRPMRMLNRADSVELLLGEGCPPGVVERVADDCGGWIGLLRIAARRAGIEGGWDAAARGAVMPELQNLLGKTLLPAIRDAQGLNDTDAAWRAVILDIAQSAHPTARYGLPTRFAASGREGLSALPPLLQSFRQPPTFLVLDVENLRMPFEREECVNPDLYGGRGIDAYTREHFPRLVAWLSELFSVPESGVVLAAKSGARARQVFGQLKPEWQVYSVDSIRKRKHQEDDRLALVFIAKQAGSDPRSRFVLVSGDGGYAASLAEHGVRHITYYSPSTFPARVLDLDLPAQLDWEFRSNLLADAGLRGPEAVSDEAYNSARQRQR